MSSGTPGLTEYGIMHIWSYFPGAVIMRSIVSDAENGFASAGLAGVPGAAGAGLSCAWQSDTKRIPASAMARLRGMGG